MQLLHYLQAQLNGVISKKPAVLVMTVGIPNIGKSALINSLHQIARTRFPGISVLFFSRIIKLSVYFISQGLIFCFMQLLYIKLN